MLKQQSVGDQQPPWCRGMSGLLLNHFVDKNILYGHRVIISSCHHVIMSHFNHQFSMLPLIYKQTKIAGLLRRQYCININYLIFRRRNKSVNVFYYIIFPTAYVKEPTITE